MQNAKLLNYLHLHGIVFIWGFTAVLGALISIDAIPLVWFRMLLASGFILLFVLLKKEKLRFSTKTLSLFFLAGFIIALHWLCFFGAIKESNVSVTLAIMSTGAFFASILEPLFYRRKIIGYEVFFGIIVIGGLYLIFNVETDYILGISLALASAFLGAVFTIINGALVVKHKASVISLYELFFGALCITVYLAFKGKITSELFQLSTNDWFFLILLASVCTAYAFLASVHVMKWITPYTVMLTVNLEPVYGIILALLILGDAEHMNAEFYYGAAIIIVTVIANGIIKNRLQRKKRRLPNT